MRRPSSSGGNPGTRRSSSRSRTQPASNQPQRSAAAARAPAPRRAKLPPYGPHRRKSDLELLERRTRIDDVTLELQLGFLEARGDADELCEMEDGHAELPSRLRLELLLPGVERE